MAKVIYLTGAPAAGKSSTTRLLAEQVPALAVWEYGAELTKFVQAKNADVGDQDGLRSASATVVTAADVATVDQALLAFVSERRGRVPVLIDSHAVTKEAFGFRITPFSLAQFQLLLPDEVWVLYASPKETRRRIELDPGGRPLVTLEEAQMHTALQGSVAATYGMATGNPVYFFDTAVPREALVGRLVERLS